ncbi:unnamed protein product [Rotaria sp. Silwood1]|nr:unnamed protein product [Rotaria sp. Silwood1]CAF1679538.1 unnamed protein product [Rotaria sp. Silwood1]CAF3934890.1 unnamed protein product [Rotaria sp. Silwood1]CAF4934739.1 unnamed protein product [Rotaria sp. Silwood1]CAF4984298.1 unnamed protein product [Rotaria sp. Silwood1]
MASNLSTQILLKGIQPIELFTAGDEQDPMTWIQSVEELFDATKVDNNDRRRLLPMYFGDDVKKWYRSETLSSDYDEFKQQFINSFTSSVHKLKVSTKLMNRRQGNDESVQSYYYDILALCARFNSNMMEDEKILYLLRGLKPSIQQHVIMSDPKTCKDLFEHAKRAEAAATVSSPSSEQTSTITNELMDETTAALRRTSINQNIPSNVHSIRKTLNNRGKSNNYHAHERSNQSQYRKFPKPNSSNFTCYNCNGIGHYAYQCPSYLN